ncbi:MAG: APC family permease [Fimbriimonadaceae bacterium]|jgi:amino acid transporter|nr:APC family permease [Fimbriimonadaceae bacterium]
MPFFAQLKRVLFGQPIATKQAHTERLPKRYGLAVFSSDALSSVAYATEEVQLILKLAGTIGAGIAYYNKLVPIVFVLGFLLVIIAISYYQTIHAYPEGGGSYSVSKSNLGHGLGRIAGAALLIDYILTVAVSVSAGVAALVSAVPAIHGYEIHVAVGAVVFITFLNLRGAKESGAIFAIPTYAFIVGTLTMGIYGFAMGVGKPPIPPPLVPMEEGYDIVMWFLLLKAFAASCTALTGIEAISNGVQAFKKPEAENASKTLIVMVVILFTMFFFVSWCAHHYGILPQEPGTPGYQTVMAQIAGAVFGANSFGFYFLQFSTVGILFLAANTAYADFPRLSSLLARDGILPRVLQSQGDRLVFNNGILVLTAAAILLILGFRADTHLLVPLYAIGVFTAFTLSQSGMVVRWLKLGRAWSLPFVLNLIGAIMTGIVSISIALTKFEDGAWVTIFALGGVYLMFHLINKHYKYLARELSIEPTDQIPQAETAVMLLVPRMHKGILQAIAYAQALSTDVRAMHVTLDQKSVGQIKKDWTTFGADIPLVILESPYRSLVDPILEYVDQAIEENPDLMVTVIVPQAMPKYPWHSLLHSNAATSIKRALGSRKNVVVTNVRYFLS